MKGAKKKADKLWRSIGKEFAQCEVCLTLPVLERVKYTKLDAHHIISRGRKRLKFDLRNRCWLCSSHHTLSNKCAEKNQEGWFWDKSGNTGWMGTHRPEDKKYLAKHKEEITHYKLHDYVKIIEELERKHERS